MSHWYNLKGKLHDGATLREARKHNLVPSVTTFLGEIKSPVLEKWKVKMAINKTWDYLADLYVNNPGKLYEIDDNIVKEILSTYLEKADNAADFGTTVHNLIERYCRGELIDFSGYDIKILNAVENAIDWLSENVENILEVEKTLVSNEYGFAGTIDLIAQMQDKTIAIIDFKTQTAKNGKLYSYDSWCYQLAAYRLMADEHYTFKIDNCINLVLASNENLVKEFKHDVGKIDIGEEIALSALKIFRYSRNFFWEVPNENNN